MEGACDKEARSITCQVAERFALPEPSETLGALSYRDATGTLTGEDTGRTIRELDSPEQAQYAANLVEYEKGVNHRYAHFLEEFSPGEEDECHTRIIEAIISGDPGPLGAWLDDRHGPGTFAGLFRTPRYFEPGLTA